MFCKAGALDLCKTYEKVEQEFPGRLKIIGVGIELIGFEDFKAGRFFNHEIYIDKNKGLYKALQYKKPGILSCFGFCRKSVIKKKNEIEEKYKDKKFTFEADFKKDLFQMGGSLMITQRGKVLLEHVDAYYGDQVKEEEIMEEIRGYYEYANVLPARGSIY